MRGRLVSLRHPHAPHTRKELGTFPTWPRSFISLLSKKAPGLKLETQASSPACLCHLMRHLVPLNAPVPPAHCLLLAQATTQPFTASSLASRPPCLQPHSSNSSLL